MGSINHHPSCRILNIVSYTIIVLELANRYHDARMILQREENKGVELTGEGNSDWGGSTVQS